MSTKKHKKTKKKSAFKSKKKSAHALFFASGNILQKKSFLIVVALAGAFTLFVVAASYSIQKTAATAPSTFKSIPQWRMERVITEMTAGHPIIQMLPFIFEQDQLTAAYLVSIAKKESNWGKRAPQKEGMDCYNYWGYKGEGSRGIALGHGCFGSPEEAVKVVSTRIDTLTQKYDLETPRQMVVWKCGSSCAGHSDASVQKWIRDVAYYTDEIKMATN